MKIEIRLSDMEELILESLTKRSRTTEQIRYYLEGRGMDVPSYSVSRALINMTRMGLVTRERGCRVYRYKLAIEHAVTDED